MGKTWNCARLTAARDTLSHRPPRSAGLRIGVGLVAATLGVIPIGSFAVETAHALVLPSWRSATPQSPKAQHAPHAVLLAAPNCRSITTWGFTDKHSWIPYFFTGFGAALPWDANLQTKPAYDVIAPLLRN